MKQVPPFIDPLYYSDPTLASDTAHKLETLHDPEINAQLKAKNLNTDENKTSKEKKLSEDEKRSPIHRAAREKDLQMMIELINSGIDINVVDYENQTPLHYAVLAEDLRIVNFLIKKKAKIDFKDIEGKTPLHHAVHLKNKEISKRLIEAKANKVIKNNEGLTPFDISKSQTNPDEEIMRLLKPHYIDYIKPWIFSASIIGSLMALIALCYYSLKNKWFDNLFNEKHVSNGIQIKCGYTPNVLNRSTSFIVQSKI